MALNETVTYSKAIDEKIQTICLNYMQLMLDCGKNESMREDFFKRPYYYFTEKVGMIIPPNAKIVLVKDYMGRPTVYINMDDENVIITESLLEVSVIEKLKSKDSEIRDNLIKNKKISLKPHAKVEITGVKDALKDNDVVVSIPFFDVHSDMLTEIKFDKEAEILLTCC